jgi:hypothetical protein
MVIPVSITVERAFGKFQQTYGIYECAPHAAETLAELLAVLAGTGGNHSRVVCDLPRESRIERSSLRLHHREH